MQEFCDKSLEELRHEYYQVTPACRTVRGGGGGPSEWPGVQLPEQDRSRLVSKTKGRPVWRELRQGRLTSVLAKGRLAACSSSTNTAPSLAFDGVTPLSPRYDPSAEGHTSTVLGAAPSPDTATPGAGTSPVFGAFATSKASLSFSFSKLNIVGEGDWSTTRVYDSAASAGYNNNTNVPKDKIFSPQLTLDLPTVFGRTVKATQSWFEEPAIEEQISCPVCMETYLAVTRSPVVLPRCGHTFCRPCLTRLEERGSVQSPALEERGSVQSPALEERGSVQSPALEERGSVQSPALEERGSVQSPALEERGSVQSPALEERGSVQSPALEERGSVQSPALEERGSVRVQSPALEERGSVQSPALEERGSVQSPALEERGSVQSPALVERGSVQSPALEERGSVQSPALEERGSVQSPALEERGSVQSPALEERGSVQSPALEERGSVQSPALEETGSVQSPALEERGSVQSPALEERGSVQSPALEEQGSVQSPALEERGSVQSPALEERGSVQSPALEERGGVQSPALEERGSVQSPALEERGGVQSPALEERGSVQSPALEERGSVQSPALEERGSVQSPALEERGSVECPVCKTAHFGVSVSELPILYTILNLSEAYTKAKASGSVLERCESHGDQLCVWCRHCSEALCGLCLLDTQRHKSHKLERIINIADINNNVKQQARNFFEYSENRQNKITNELHLIIRRIVELCHMSNSIQGQVKTVSEVMTNYGNQAGIKRSMEALSQLGNALKTLHHVTGSLRRGEEMVGQAVQSGASDEANMDYIGSSRLLTVRSNPEQVRGCEGSDNEGDSSQPEGSAMVGEAGVQVERSVNGLGANSQVKRSLGDENDSIQVGESYNRSHTEAAGNRSQTEAAGNRSQTEAAGSRSQTEAAGSRSHTEAAGNRSQTEAAGNRSQTEAAGNRSQTETAGNRSHTEAADNRSQTEAAGNRSHTEAAGNRSHTEAAGNRSQTEAAGNRSHTEAAGNRSQTEAAGNRSHTEAAGNRSHTEAAGNRSQTEAADNRSRTEVVALRCCGTISDGRQMGLTLEDEHLHLCALTPSPLHPHITLQVPLLERFLSREKPEVFFDLSVDNKCLGRIYIQLWGDMRRAKHFLALCLGTLGPSYKGSKFDRISDRSQPGEVLHCKGYSDKSGPSSLGLMDNLEWDGKYRQLQKAGQLIASGGGQAQTDGSFGICTKDNLFKTFSCPFGMVVSGMDVVREAVNHAGDVVVSEVGAVAVDINCQD
ncbi:uncharacterized protein [Procambarus clarkii]|uniref:uncharacterized protein n=1 Tax=Procambarus clarkii TaxID=6728 RepID=UPI00374301DD